MQAFIIAGGLNNIGDITSVVTLLPGATAWTELAPLPRELYDARASIVGGRMRVTGGKGANADGSPGASIKFEVMIDN